MRLIGFILVALIALAAFKATVIVLFAIYPLALLWAIVVKPAETFGFLCFVVIMFLLDNHPAMTLGTVVALVLIGAVAKPPSE